MYHFLCVYVTRWCIPIPTFKKLPFTARKLQGRRYNFLTNPRMTTQNAAQILVLCCHGYNKCRTFGKFSDFPRGMNGASPDIDVNAKNKQTNKQTKTNKTNKPLVRQIVVIIVSTHYRSINIDNQLWVSENRIYRYSRIISMIQFGNRFWHRNRKQVIIFKHDSPDRKASTLLTISSLGPLRYCCICK